MIDATYTRVCQRLAEAVIFPMSYRSMDDWRTSRCCLIRHELDRVIAAALPISGGEVRKRLKQLRRALAEGDAKRDGTP